MATRPTTRPTRQPAAGRTRLDRDVVVSAALALVDSDGLEALTVRRLATELEVSPMALYWHFADKEALLGGLSERLWSDVVAELSVLDVGTGWDAVRGVMAALVGVLRTHPSAAPLAPLQVMVCEPGLAVTERTLELLSGLGFDEEHGAQMAFLLLLQAVALVGAEPGAMAEQDGGDRWRQKRAALASLPPGRYPRVVAAAEHLTACDRPEVFYDRGISLVVDGIRHQLP